MADQKSFDADAALALANQETNETGFEQLPTPASLIALRRLPVFQKITMNQLKFMRGLLARNMVVEHASAFCGLEWRNHYRWLKASEDYKNAVAFVKEMLADKLESTMLDHAIQGRPTPIVYKGQITGQVREVNAQERIALLKGLKPEYRDNYQINAFAGPQNIAFVYPQNLPKLPNIPKEIDDKTDDS